MASLPENGIWKVNEINILRWNLPKWRRKAVFLLAAIHKSGMIGVVDSICSGSAIIYNH